MRIKQYVVTYNNPDILNGWYLNSFFEALSPKELKMVDHYVINNHSNFSIYNNEHSKHLKILHNTLRPNQSCGHLSRNWNQGLINGFQNLKNPDADIVILVQHDTIFEKNYIDKIIEVHSKGISLFTDGAGDQFHSYTVEAVKRVGLWDERFCSIGFQEADYFLRQILYNSKHLSLNDDHHGRTFNIIPLDVLKPSPTGYSRKDINFISSSKYFEYNKRLWYWKYKVDHWDWSVKGVLDRVPDVINNNMWFLFYPWFEKDVETLTEQGYLFPDFTVETEEWK